VVASVTSAELRQLVDGIRFIETMRRNPVDKAVIPARVAPLRDIFMKSIVAGCDLRAGAMLDETHLAFKKPGGGLPPTRFRELVGRRLRRDVARDRSITFEDLE
jgi:N-acetylneuraminate synthase